jgi:hypothetical protein
MSAFLNPDHARQPHNKIYSRLKISPSTVGLRTTIMASKRKYEDDESISQPLVHESRQFQVPNVGKHPRSNWVSLNPHTKKPRNSKQPDSREEPSENSVNAIKKRIRDITRRLERVADLPANVRAEDERALEDYERQLAAAEASNALKKIIGKYKMVRFFGMNSRPIPYLLLTYSRITEGRTSRQEA